MESHVGVSELRKCNSKSLRGQTDVLIIHNRAEPIAAMIPYELFMAIQIIRASQQASGGEG